MKRERIIGRQGTQPATYRRQAGERCWTTITTLRLLCAGFVAMTLIVPLNAQDTRVSFRGKVLDPSNAAIVGAQIRAIAAGATSQTTAVSDQDGQFLLMVMPGRYALTITAGGFAESSETIEIRDISQPGTFVLSLAGLQETVSVTDTLGYQVGLISSATRTLTPLRDVPQSVSVVTSQLIAEQKMQSMADVVRYMPGVGMAQGEGNRDTPILRGNSSTADFFVDGVRDDVEYFRDLYNADRVEAIKGPNAMTFGRGGVGGVINRVTRQAAWEPTHEVSVHYGSWNNRRLTADFGDRLTDQVAARLTGLFEKSDSYRNGVGIRRYGANPTLAYALGPNTTLRGGYEYFHDERTADRGVSSYNGLPVSTDPSTFFGNAALSPTHATVHLLSSVVEHRVAGSITLRNRLSYGDYDKFYQNVFPGAVNAAGTTVNVSAYNNATQRRNLFNQSDLIVVGRTGGLGHTFLAGMELGRQETNNFRNTGFFSSLGPNVTSLNVPLENPTTSLPMDFRQNATDADNHGVATVAAVYAQDQVSFTEHIQAVVGVRFDRFNVDFRNHRTATDFMGRDNLVSPRVGLIYKPTSELSVYGSYSLTYLPRSGAQLSSLSLTNQALEPERFSNYELGAKWDASSNLSFTTAVYRLDRGNVVVPDPADNTRSILVDAQRTKGLELGLNGNLTRRWSVAGGYAFQDGEITRSISATAQAGATLAQVPSHSFSLWNRYNVASRLGFGLGLIRRTDLFTSTDNLVRLPAFTRVDAGVFFNVNAKLRAQVNVENLFDEDYYASAHSNTNITPGSPRAVRIGLTTRF